jgi:putative oxidoreductase
MWADARHPMRGKSHPRQSAGANIACASCSLFGGRPPLDHDMIVSGAAACAPDNGPGTGSYIRGTLMALLSDTDSPSSHPLLSYADRCAVMWQDFLLLVGRILLGWIFFQSGWGKIFNLAQYATTFPRRGLAPWMAYVSVPAEFLGGLFLIFGFATRYTALVLLFFTIVASFSSHAYWTVPDAQRAAQSSQFWKNVSIMGGMIITFVVGAGRISLDRLLCRKG